MVSDQKWTKLSFFFERYRKQPRIKNITSETKPIDIWYVIEVIDEKWREGVDC
jgi:hypothetical protein